MCWRSISNISLLSMTASSMAMFHATGKKWSGSNSYKPRRYKFLTGQATAQSLIPSSTAGAPWRESWLQSKWFQQWRLFGTAGHFISWKLAKSMPRHLQDAICLKGKMIKYWFNFSYISCCRLQLFLPILYIFHVTPWLLTNMLSLELIHWAASGGWMSRWLNETPNKRRTACEADCITWHAVIKKTILMFHLKPRNARLLSEQKMKGSL